MYCRVIGACLDERPVRKRQSRRTDARSVCGRSFSAEGELGTAGRVAGQREQLQCRRHWDARRIHKAASLLLQGALCVWSWSVVYRLRFGVSKSEAFPHTCKFQWSFQQQLCRPSTGRLRSLHALRAFTGKA